MLGIVSEDENQNKIFKPMAGATLGQGVPLGTWCSFEKDVAPSSNWLMAGTTFDASVYPALNLYLGTNKVPSRYDHNRLGNYESLSGTWINQGSSSNYFTPQYDGILYFQCEGGSGSINWQLYQSEDNGNTWQQIYTYYRPGSIGASGNVNIKKGCLYYGLASQSGAYGMTMVGIAYYTHPLFIKATSIASDTDQQAILAQIQAYNTYSTEETLTGKTWIDGKPIYRVVRHTVINSQLAQGYTSGNSIMTGPFTTNAETVVDIYALSYTTAGGWSKLYTTGGGGARAIAWKTDSTIYNNASDTIPNEQYIVIEYTKTTD